MSKNIGKTIRTFGHNVMAHTKRIVRGQEGLRDAVQDIADDAKKLGKTVQQAARTPERSRAQELTSRGRKHYNEKNYTRAQEYFTSAMKNDPTYALAITYLGHTLYKLGEQREAVQMWRRAIMTDPSSEAASKAEAKIRKVEGHVAEAVDTLKQNVDE